MIFSRSRVMVPSASRPLDTNRVSRPSAALFSNLRGVGKGGTMVTCMKVTPCM
jgi:hypothetical protein